MERNETQVIVSQIIYLFIWWRVRHCTVSATSVACSHSHAHSESGRRLTLNQPTNQLTNYCDRPTIGTFEVVRWWLGLVALVCSVRRTLSHVVRPVALGSDDLNFKWGTTGPFKVSRPLVGKKSKFLWGDKTKLMETHEHLGPKIFEGSAQNQNAVTMTKMTMDMVTLVTMIMMRYDAFVFRGWFLSDLVCLMAHDESCNTALAHYRPIQSQTGHQLIGNF